MSLRRLGVETIDLFQLHRVDPNFPLADQVGELVALQKEGKIRHIGLSEVNVDQLSVFSKVKFPLCYMVTLYW
jgi:pyridoxine 4-dehydrogenase